VRDLVVSIALDLAGTPYVWGGNHPIQDGGLDCSGFILHCLRDAGLDLPDTTADGLYTTLAPVDDAADLLPGDLAFYGKDRATHVVMVISTGGRVIIGASGGTRPRPGENLAAYTQRMRDRVACVRLEDTRRGGVDYRDDLLGFRRMPE